MKRAQWWLGDLLAYGAGEFGERYAQAYALTGLSFSSLQGMQWTSEKFPHFRRRRNLEWYAHHEVSGLEDQGQEQLPVAA